MVDRIHSPQTMTDDEPSGAKLPEKIDVELHELHHDREQVRQAVDAIEEVRKKYGLDPETTPEMVVNALETEIGGNTNSFEGLNVSGEVGERSSESTEVPVKIVYQGNKVFEVELHLAGDMVERATVERAYYYPETPETEDVPRGEVEPREYNIDQFNYTAINVAFNNTMVELINRRGMFFAPGGIGNYAELLDFNQE